jgi:hypothetical protein
MCADRFPCDIVAFFRTRKIRVHTDAGLRNTHFCA